MLYVRENLDYNRSFASAIEMSGKIRYTSLDMNMTELRGNARIKETLSGELGHAYLISGAEADERRTLAGILARARMCQSERKRPCNTCVACEKARREIHPDILSIRREAGKDIPVSMIRQVVFDAATLPNEAAHKVYIVEEADALNQSAQNAFLKILEEPPSFVTFLLLAENPLYLLPTVRSRCVHLSLTPDADSSTADAGEAADLAEAFWRAYEHGGLDFLHFCVGLEKTERLVLEAFIEACYMHFVTHLGQVGANRTRLQTGVRLFDSLRDDLRFNVSAGHISGKILATLL